MAENILKVENISKSFGGVQALKKVSLTINKGEIHCLAGGNGERVIIVTGCINALVSRV